MTLTSLLCIHSIQARLECVLLLGLWLLHVVMSIAWFVYVSLRARIKVMHVREFDLVSHVSYALFSM